MPSRLSAAEVVMASGPRRTRYAAIALTAAALAAAGCTTSNHAAPSTPSGGAGPGSAGPGGSLTAAKAVQLAAQHAQRVTSFAATMAVQTSGAEAVSMSGTTEEQTQPAPVLVMNFSHFSLRGQAVPGGMQEI